MLASVKLQNDLVKKLVSFHVCKFKNGTNIIKLSKWRNKYHYVRLPALGFLILYQQSFVRFILGKHHFLIKKSHPCSLKTTKSYDKLKGNILRKTWGRVHLSDNPMAFLNCEEEGFGDQFRVTQVTRIYCKKTQNFKVQSNSWYQFKIWNWAINVFKWYLRFQALKVNECVHIGKVS